MVPDIRLHRISAILAVIAMLVPGVASAEDARIPGIQTTAELGDRHLKSLRKRMVGGGVLGAADLRALADAGDGLAAFKLGKLLDDAATQDPAFQLSSRVHYFSIAVYTGREFAVAPLLRVLRGIEEPAELLGPVRLKGVEDALLAATRRGSEEAALALADFYTEGAPFGEKPAEARELLLSLSEDGATKGAEAALKLALQAIGPDPANPIDVALARELLLIAAAGSDLGVRATAENLQQLLPPALTVATEPNPAAQEITQ
jgi:hypothetical protein